MQSHRTHRSQLIGRRTLSITLAAIIACGLVLSESATSQPPRTEIPADHRSGVVATAVRVPHVVVPDVPRIATLYADGRRIRVPIEHVWRPMCFSHGGGAMSEAQLLELARGALASQPQLMAVSGPPGGGDIAGGGFNLIFDANVNVPAAARDALDVVEAYYENLFSDDITVTVNLEFDDTLPGGVLGATSTPYTSASWTSSRIGLRNGMDDNDKIQNYLPSGSTIPVRYNGNSPFVSDETRAFWTIANFNATVGFISGDAGNMRFNENIDWDYDPTNGVSGYSFVDVVMHEVGHVLGFGSGVDFRNSDIEALDIFRFQRTDGIGGTDYNPDTYAEFTTTPRLADKNLPNNDVISDLIIVQYKMEDGYPYQASHFYDKQPAIGIMDPVLGQGQTFAPKYFSPADKRMFDAIGWDR